MCTWCIRIKLQWLEISPQTSLVSSRLQKFFSSHQSLTQTQGSTRHVSWDGHRAQGRSHRKPPGTCSSAKRKSSSCSRQRSHTLGDHSTLNRHWISLNHPTYKKTESNWHTEISEGFGSFQLARCAPFPLFTRRHFLHGGWSTARGASRFAAIWQHYTPGSAQRATLQPSWQWGKLKRRRRADQTVSVGYKTTDLTHQFDTSDIWLLNLKSLVEVFMDHLLQRGRHWFLLA